MNSCVIHPIPIFQHQSDKSGYLYRFEIGHKTLVEGYIWYIEGPKEKIVVDAGASVEFISKGLQRTGCEEIQTVEQGLNKFGLSASDIDLVIMTHLHHDHLAQSHRFTKARFLVQRDELEFARNPHPVFAAGYPREFQEGVHFEDINGDFKVSEDISVISTPGHTRGGQSVSIRTAKGVAIIPCICTSQEGFDPSLVGKKIAVIPPTSHYDVFKAYDSMIRIKQMADILVPNHDPKYLRINSIP